MARAGCTPDEAGWDSPDRIQQCMRCPYSDCIGGADGCSLMRGGNLEACYQIKPMERDTKCRQEEAWPIAEILMRGYDSRHAAHELDMYLGDVIEIQRSQAFYDACLALEVEMGGHAPNRFKMARICAGLSVVQAGEKSKIANPRLYDYETGRARPSTRTMIRMAETYGVSLDYFAPLYTMPQYKPRESLTKARESMGMTVRYASSRLGVKPATLSRWERGDSRISVDKVAAIRSLYGDLVDENDIW